MTTTRSSLVHLIRRVPWNGDLDKIRFAAEPTSRLLPAVKNASVVQGDEVPVRRLEARSPDLVLKGGPNWTLVAGGETGGTLGAIRDFGRLPRSRCRRKITLSTRGLVAARRLGFALSNMRMHLPNRHGRLMSLGRLLGPVRR